MNSKNSLFYPKNELFVQRWCNWILRVELSQIIPSDVLVQDVILDRFITSNWMKLVHDQFQNSNVLYLLAGIIICMCFQLSNPLEVCSCVALHAQVFIAKSLILDFFKYYKIITCWYRSIHHFIASTKNLRSTEVKIGLLFSARKSWIERYQHAIIALLFIYINDNYIKWQLFLLSIYFWKDEVYNTMLICFTICYD